MTLGERYEVLGELGAGGMGVVYEVVDRERRVHLALKMLRPRSGSSAEKRSIQLLRFKNEFRALMDIHHRNLVSLYELVAEEDRWYFTMELVKGRDFLSHVRDQPGLAVGTAEPTTISMHSAIGAPAAPAVPPTLPPATTCDVPRLRAALRQLAAGVLALHQAGKVHRDIKPSNVLVDDDGRVVLLDFGLIMAAGMDPLAPRAAAGTPAYMAPEQARGQLVGPAADAYSIGVMLFEALTGVHFDRLVMGTEPRLLVAAIPDDLNALCRDLLAVDPARRPHGVALVARLGGDDAPTAAVRDGAFVGRGAELAVLDGALAQDGARCLVIRGDSGVGKSALIERFAQRAAAAGALVLLGRCYEREAVPFKAFDAIADQLSRHVAGLPADELQIVWPAGMEAVARIFAVFEAPAHADTAGEPRDLRDRAFAALRELLARLAARGPVVIAIDDLQWSDEDSLDLLRSLLAAPAPPILLVMATRRDHARTPFTLGALGVMPVVVELGNLPDDEAIALATTRAAELAIPIDGAAIARESRGHPLFIAELVRHAGRAAGALPRLEDALAARIHALDAVARDLLELVAIAGTPVPERTIAAAAGHAHAALAQALQVLRIDNLVRAGTRRDGRSLEPYHDRVRRAILTEIEGARLVDHHRRLATAMESDGGEPELLGALWQGAGEPARAARHYQLAGLRAADSLAFERAAGLLQRARDLGATAPVVVERLGDVRAALGDTAGACDDLEQARAALADDPPAQIRVALKLAEILRRRGLGDEAIAVLTEARARARATGSIPAEASTELALARVRMYQADYAAALAHVNAGLALGASARVLEIQRLLLQTRADIELFRGNAAQALHDVDLALALGAGDDAQIAGLHNTAGRALLHRGDLAAAIDALDVALILYRRLGRIDQEVKVSNNLAAACFHQGAWQRAEQYWLRCREVAARMGDAQELSQTLNNLGYLYLQQGALERAEANLDHAMALAREGGREHVLAMSLGNRGELHLQRRQLGDARRCLERALATFTRIGASDDRRETLRRLAAVTLAEGRPADALAEALALRAEPDVATAEQIALACVAAAALRALDRAAEARAHLAQVRELAGSPLDAARLDLAESRACAAAGAQEEAAQLEARAIAGYGALGALAVVAREAPDDVT